MWIRKCSHSDTGIHRIRMDNDTLAFHCPRPLHTFLRFHTAVDKVEVEDVLLASLAELGGLPKDEKYFNMLLVTFLFLLVPVGVSNVQIQKPVHLAFLTTTAFSSNKRIFFAAQVLDKHPSCNVQSLSNSFRLFHFRSREQEITNHYLFEKVWSSELKGECAPTP